MESTEKINAIMVLEVIGKPAEHLTATLKDIAEKIKQEKGVEIKEEKIHDPKLMQNQKDFYTSFAEIQLETEELIKLVELIFKYMPAHIEILSPDSIKSSNNELGELLSNIIIRLHKYEELARAFEMKTSQMQQKIDELENKDK